MGEMASSVAHELNQPLTAISNYCNGMISRVQEDRITQDELLGALEKTARQAQRAGQIIQRIRAFVKRSEPNPTLSDVSLMVSNAIELADIELRRQQVRLTPYVAARLPSLLVDPILIEQVLINLLKNAGEAIAQAGRLPGQRHVELRVGPKRQEDQDVVEFAVRDSGSGVPDEMIERVYERSTAPRARAWASTSSCAEASWNRTTEGCKFRTSTMAPKWWAAASASGSPWSPDCAPKAQPTAPPHSR
jgi:C4-dicarboxylate-specific signal transduction histidine kinase